ncbi:MAG: MerR family transcriptional regulator [Kangiella sp.]|nr:MAG: MerR family transcriptional regulator [Kangiella sp.]
MKQYHLNDENQSQENHSQETLTYSISELSKEFEITPRSIRYYEAEGLISPQRQGSQRVYHRGDLIRLQLILRGKRVGFSLSEIREIINLYDSPKGEQKQTTLLLGKIEERRNALYQQQKDIKTMLSELDRLEIRINQPEK